MTFGLTAAGQTEKAPSHKRVPTWDRQPKANQFQEIIVLEECHDVAHLKRKILGPKGRNVHFIQDSSGASVWLRESPMQLEICASTEQALELAVNMARDLANAAASDQPHEDRQQEDLIILSSRPRAAERSRSGHC